MEKTLVEKIILNVYLCMTQGEGALYKEIYRNKILDDGFGSNFFLSFRLNLNGRYYLISLHLNSNLSRISLHKLCERRIFTETLFIEHFDMTELCNKVLNDNKYKDYYSYFKRLPKALLWEFFKTDVSPVLTKWLEQIKGL